MSETNPTEHREFERHALEFEVEVFTAPGEPRVLIERTVLVNISRGGVCFFSKRHDLYAIGQKILLHICMPGTDTMDAGMECRARIAWLHQMQAEEADQQKLAVGVHIDGMLTFMNSTHEKVSEDLRSDPWA